MNHDKSDRFRRALDYAIGQLAEWEYRECICAIYLYGSYARNENKEDSDIDLYIQTDKDTNMSLLRQLVVLCNPEDYTLPEVEVRVERGEDRFMQNDLFHRNLRKDAVLLWRRQ